MTTVAASSPPPIPRVAVALDASRCPPRPVSHIPEGFVDGGLNMHFLLVDFRQQLKTRTGPALPLATLGLQLTCGHGSGVGTGVMMIHERCRGQCE